MKQTDATSEQVQALMAAYQAFALQFGEAMLRLVDWFQKAAPSLALLYVALEAPEGTIRDPGLLQRHLRAAEDPIGRAFYIVDELRRRKAFREQQAASTGCWFAGLYGKVFRD